MLIPKMIAKDISTKENVMTDSVKEGTEGIVDISPTKLDATEETAASTFTLAVEKKQKENLEKRIDDVQDTQEEYKCIQCENVTYES